MNSEVKAMHMISSGVNVSKIYNIMSVYYPYLYECLLVNATY